MWLNLPKGGVHGGRGCGLTYLREGAQGEGVWLNLPKGGCTGGGVWLNLPKGGVHRGCGLTYLRICSCEEPKSHPYHCIILLTDTW